MVKIFILLLLLGLGSIILIFTGDLQLKIVELVLCGSIGALAFIKSKKKSTSEEVILPKEIEIPLHPIPENYLHSQEAIEEMARSASAKVFEEPLSLLENLFPVLESLSKIVSKKIENSAQSLGQEIFALSESMNRLGTTVSQVMTKISEGDQSLDVTIGNLKEKIALMDGIEKVFIHLQGGFSKSLDALKKTSATIHDFSENISDLADQTNILAINASIEAARVGNAGRGFAVIANQVQILSKQSKDLAEKMTNLFKDVVESMETSFENNSKSITNAVTLISTGRRDMGVIIDVLSPQVSHIHDSIISSKNLVQSVSIELKEVTVNLQFQDITKQILDHIISILMEIRKTILEAPENNLDINKMTTEPYKTKAHELAAKFFTVDDEWQTVSIDPLHIKNRLENQKKIQLF